MTKKHKLIRVHHEAADCVTQRQLFHTPLVKRSYYGGGPREPFRRIFSEWIIGVTSKRYAVYSYGKHYPMYVYDDELKMWFGNEDKYSRSTSSHMNHACPRATIMGWVNTSTMKRLVADGAVRVLGVPVIDELKAEYVRRKVTGA